MAVTQITATVAATAKVHPAAVDADKVEYVDICAVAVQLYPAV
jgi:hypothetical protein